MKKDIRKTDTGADTDVNADIFRKFPYIMIHQELLIEPEIMPQKI